MPNIPVPTSQVSARTGRTSGPFLDTNADPNAYGAGVGRAMRALGGDLGNLGSATFEVAERKRKERVANAVAQADFTPREVKVRQEVGADAAEYHERVLSEYSDFIEEEANKIDDDDARMEFRRMMEQNRNEVSSRSALYQEKASAENSKTEADKSLTSLENRIMTDPMAYDKLVTQGQAVIAAQPGLTATQINSMQQQWRYNSARGRFVGMLEAASTPEDIDNIEAELLGQVEGGKDWSKEFAANDFEDMRNKMQTVRNAFVTVADTQARAAIETLEDRNTGLTPIPRDELAAAAQVVKSSQNPVTQARFARIVRDQDIIRSTRGASPEQLRQDIARQDAYSNLPPVLSGAVNEAASIFGVSASYLGTTIQREYGGILNGEQTDWGVKAGTSSATGVMQFLNDTFLELMKDGTTPQRIGVSVAGKSDAEILEMRKDPRVAVLAGAAFAAGNKRYVEGQIGRPINDAEMYMAHFLGAGGATTLLKAVGSDPSQSAASLFPEQARANYNIFYHEKGDRAKSVQEVYNSLARSFSNDPSAVAYGDMDTRNRILSETETKVAADPMSLAQEQGMFDVGPLTDSSSFAARGASARAVADHYSIPMTDFKPLTVDETAALSKRMETGDADAVLAVLSDVQAMGGDVARAAFRQLGQKDPVYAYAAGLSYDANAAGAAGDVVRGRKRIEENKAIADGVGTAQDISAMFSRVTGASLFDLAPRDRQAVQDAAFAHYVETFVSRGGNGLDENAFNASVNAVLGAQDTPALATVNGAPTVLPPGVTSDTMEAALDRMTVADWTQLSPQKTPPRYVTGAVADPADLAREAVLRPVGGGLYKVMFDDGTFAITGAQANGRYEAYLFQPEPKTINEIATRVPDKQGMTTEEMYGNAGKAAGLGDLYGSNTGKAEIGGSF